MPGKKALRSTDDIAREAITVTYTAKVGKLSFIKSAEYIPDNERSRHAVISAGYTVVREVLDAIEGNVR